MNADDHVRLTAVGEQPSGARYSHVYGIHEHEDFPNGWIDFHLPIPQELTGSKLKSTSGRKQNGH